MKLSILPVGFKLLLIAYYYANISTSNCLDYEFILKIFKIMQALLSDQSYGIDYNTYFDSFAHFCPKHRALILNGNSILSPYAKSYCLLADDRPHLNAYSAILRSALLESESMSDYLTKLDNCTTIDEISSLGEHLITKCVLLDEKREKLSTFECLEDVKQFIKAEAENFSAKKLKFKKFVKPICERFCSSALIQSALLRTEDLKLILIDTFDPLNIFDGHGHIYQDCEKTCLVNKKKNSWSSFLLEERSKLDNLYK